jgi:phage gp46-like protein
VIRIGYTYGAGFDLVKEHGRLQTDDGLETAVIISLWTDARATDDELRLAGLPIDDRRGYWGTRFGNRVLQGSKIWLLARALRTDEALRQCEAYSSEALAWLLEDRVAQSVVTRASWHGSTGLMVLQVDIYRPRAVQPRWRRVWEAISGDIVEAA